MYLKKKLKEKESVTLIRVGFSKGQLSTKCCRHIGFGGCNAGQTMSIGLLYSLFN
jgi:hypothetical protein